MKYGPVMLLPGCEIKKMLSESCIKMRIAIHHRQSADFQDCHTACLSIF